MRDFLRDLLVALVAVLIVEQSSRLSKALIWLWTRFAPQRVADQFKADWEADSATIKEPLTRILFAFKLGADIPGLWRLHGTRNTESTDSPDYSSLINITRILDLFLLVLLIPLLPLFGLLLLLIRIQSGGAPLYKQDGLGYKNEAIYVYRFRLGYVGDDHRELGNRAFHTPAHYDEGQKLTPIGRYIATHGLWRVPLIINVITGSLSFIGPHLTFIPHISYPFYNPILEKIKPGLIAYSSEHLIATHDYGRTIDYANKYELYYLSEWSLKLWSKTLCRGISRYLIGMVKHFILHR